jgi:CheY-like chemotaxis protein
MRRVARTEGFSVEPATAVAFAGLEKLIQQGQIRADERVVVNCSGHTFSAEKHALEDRYILHLETAENTTQPTPAKTGPLYHEGLSIALKQLDEQVTTIVIIDDNPHDSRLIRRLLQSHKNYRVFEATNGPDGIDLVRQRQPDLVVLDLTLPDMDGFSILDALKRDSRTSAIPVMIVSAKSLTPDEDAYLRQQTDSVWQKGNFNARELLEHVLGRLGDEPAEQRVPSIAPPRMAGTEINSTLQWQSHEQRTTKPRILIIDDNMLDARLLRRLFEARQRFEVVETYSAQHALASIQDKIPDLIILDLLLPDTKGEALLNMLRTQAETRNIPVIVVSAKMLDNTLRAQLKAQADSIWEKGVMDRNSLLAHIETMLTE